MDYCARTVTAQVVFIVYPGATFGELSPLAQLLSSSATQPTSIVIAGPTREPVRVSEGYRLAVDRSFAQVELEDVALVAVAGGDPESVLDDLSLLSLLDLAAERGIPMAAVCNGALLLGRAGVLRGRAVTHTAIEPYATKPAFELLLESAKSCFRGARYVDEDVVVDEDEAGVVLTAKPWAAIALAQKALVAAGLVDRPAAASRARYLRGARDASHGAPYERWIIELAQVEGRTATREDIEAHVAHLRALEADGTLALAGPVPEAKSGLVVLRDCSRERAEQIAREDPFVLRGVRTYTLRKWLLSCDDNDHLLA